jgi:hypothetical protein
MATRLITDEDTIKAATDLLEHQINITLAEFKAFKIKRNLRSRAAIDTVYDALTDIGCEIGYLSYQYWSFLRKLRAQDRNVLDYINNYLGWLTIEFDAKLDQLYKLYPVLND